MSDAKQCNRCGKYYELIPKNLPGTKTGPKYSVNYFKQLGNLASEIKSFDLCPECAQQFAEWVENPDSIILDPNKFDKVTVISPEETEKMLKQAKLNGGREEEK